MNICDKYKLIFFHYPKTAGLSVVKALDIKTSDKTNLESGLRQTIGLGVDYLIWNKTIYPDKWNNYTKFTIIRNPWDRMVSLYNFRKRENNLYNMCISQLGCTTLGGDKLGPDGTEWSFKRWIFSLFIKGFAGPVEDKLYQLQRRKKDYIDKVLSFDSKTLKEAKNFHKYFVYDNFYIESCMSREKFPVISPKGPREIFFLSMLRERIEWLNQIDVMSNIPISKNLKSKIMVDYILRFEHLDRDWNNMFKEFGHEPPKLPVTNKYKHKHYSEYYDNETREFIGYLFKKDIDAFGYKFKYGE